jgi:hypothetical protein
MQANSAPNASQPKPHRRWYQYGLRTLLAVATAIAQSATAPGAAPEAVGNLTGRFIVRGKVPPPAFFGPVMPRTGKRLTDEMLVVTGKDQAISNVFVYLFPTNARVAKPDAGGGSGNDPPVVVAICDGRLVPHAVWLQESQRLLFRNDDHERCSVKLSPPELAPGLAADSNQLWIEPNALGAVDVRRFNSLPGWILGLHPEWLRGSVLVTAHPYASITDADGKFVIKGIPVGEWTFAVSHELAVSSIRHVVIGGKAVEWKHARFSYSIRPGTNSLGTVEIPGEVFGK